MNCIVEAWKNHEAELRGFMYRKLKDPMLAEDLLQDTFIKALGKGKGFCNIEQPRAWLFRVARNNMVDYLRRNPQLVELDDKLSEPIKEMPGVETLSGCLPSAMSSLEADDLDIITQCDLNGMTQAEYAKLKGLSLPGAKSRVQRARKRLKRSLNSMCGVRYDESGNICCYDTSKC